MPTKATTRLRKKQRSKKPFRTFHPHRILEPLEDRRLLTTTVTGNATVDEGSSYTLQLSSSVPNDRLSWDIDWGDGQYASITFVNSTFPGTSSVNHSYADGSNSYTISARVEWYDPGSDGGVIEPADPLTVQVDNVAPNLTFSQTPAFDGLPFWLSLNSSDPGVDTISSWEINWGNGNVETIDGNPSSASHTYLDGLQSHVISAQATDEDGTYAATDFAVESNLEWARQFGSDGLGSPATLNPYATTTDSSGNVLIAGEIDGVLPGETAVDGSDTFVCKYDSQGNVLWTQQFGTDGNDFATGVATDADGNIYLSGITGINSTSVPRQAILKKLTPDGDEVWTIIYPAESNAYGTGVAVDALGNAYLSGWEGVGVDNLGFVVKYDSAGNVIWSKLVVQDVGSVDPFDSRDDVGVDAVVVDGVGNIFVVGTANGAYNGFTNAGGLDVFIQMIDSMTGDAIWTRQFGTAGDDFGVGAALDRAGGVYVESQQEDGSITSIARFNDLGNQLWVSQFDSYYFPEGITADATGAYVATSIDEDAVVKKFAPNGDELGAVSIGSLDYDAAYGVAVAPSGAVYVVGYTNGDIAGLSMPGATDAFVVRLKVAPTAHAGGPYAVDEGGSVVLDGSASHDDKLAASELTYAWDLDADGIFGESGGEAARGDETGLHPSFSATNLDGPNTATVSLKVLDDWGLVSSISTTTVTVQDAAPTASVTGPGAGVRGQSLAFTFSADDISSADDAAGFAYAIDYGDGNTATVTRTAGNGSEFPLQHTYAASGTYTVTVTATDKDSSVSSAASLPVTITSVLLLGGELRIGGTTAADTIALNATGTAGEVNVLINGLLQGIFTPTGPIYLFGQAGDDTVTVNVSSPAGANLDGQAGADHYIVNFGGLGGNVAISDSGSAADVDTVVVNGTATADVITLRMGKVEWGNPVLETVFYGGTEDLTVDGKGGNDSIRIVFSQTTILGGDGDDNIIVEGNGPHGLLIDGQNGSDTYNIQLGSLQGPITVNDQGTSGTDALTVTGTSGNDAIQLTGGTVTSGTQTITVATTIDTMTVNGGGGTDSVSVAGTPPAALTMQWLSDYRFQGTSGNDSMEFSPRGKAGEIEFRLNGVKQSRFNPGTTGRIIALGLDGNDDIQVAGSIKNSAWLYGGNGDDRLKGGAGNDVLLGGNGDDLLSGEQGRDLLIGQLGADRIVGNADDDILIAGFTDSDADEASLAAIAAEWTSARSYAQRTANITGGGTGSSFAARLNGNVFLNIDAALGSITVHDDNSKDTLTGSEGQDWFFANLFLDGGDDADRKDKITDLGRIEFALDLDFLAQDCTDQDCDEFDCHEQEHDHD